MLAKILAIPDLHKKYSDGSTIKNQFEAQLLVQEDIVTCVKENGITHIFQLGDWYDRGFHGLCMAYGSIEMDRRISASVNGNVYITIGNHFYLERDENPEMYIVQPNPFIKPQYNIPLPEKPIFHCEPKLRIGNVQIDFFHYSKIDKDYVSPIDDGVTFHIGVYHDEVCVPAWVREQEGFSNVVSGQGYLQRIYNNIDLALHGHIHSKVGVCEVQLVTGKKVPCVIPGALGIAQNKTQFKHSFVDCPVLTINDDSSVQLSFLRISTHIDKLRFYDTQKKRQKTLLTDTEIYSGNTNPIKISAELQSLGTYMQKRGYNEMNMKLLDAAVSNSLTLIDVIRILCGG